MKNLHGDTGRLSVKQRGVLVFLAARPDGMTTYDVLMDCRYTAEKSPLLGYDYVEVDRFMRRLINRYIVRSHKPGFVAITDYGRSLLS